MSTDPDTGQRVSAKTRTEADARDRARGIEQRLARAKPIHDLAAERARTVQMLADRYVADHLVALSLRYRERQEYLLRSWILPRLGPLSLTEWGPADSQAVLNAVRSAGRSPALAQDVGATMRSLVTHARRLRWFGPSSDDPMWMVSYSKRASIQGAGAVYVPRSSLPTDEQCDALFAAMATEKPTWALAMRLKHRSGLRWGELTALCASDITCGLTGDGGPFPAGRVPAFGLSEADQLGFEEVLDLAGPLREGDEELVAGLRPSRSPAATQQTPHIVVSCVCCVWDVRWTDHAHLAHRRRSSSQLRRAPHHR